MSGTPSFLPCQNNTSKRKPHPNPHAAESLAFSRDCRCDTGLVCSFGVTSVPQPHRLHGTRREAPAGSPGASPACLPSSFPCSLGTPLIHQDYGTAFPVPLGALGRCSSPGAVFCLPNLEDYFNKSAFALSILQMVTKELRGQMQLRYKISFTAEIDCPRVMPGGEQEGEEVLVTVT